tara:strand:- start:157 stop:783 length:627 start_codon:yes stop_codon:yes gene_type:complete
VKYKKYWRKTSLKQKDIGNHFLKEILLSKPKNFLEIGVFQGVTARNICELLYKIHKDNFRYIGIDLFEYDENLKDEVVPNINFNNPLKQFYYKYIKRENPYSLISVKKLLKRFEKNVEIIKGDSKEILPNLDLTEVDYVFLDGGHSYETVKNDLNNCKIVIENNGIVLCDDYNLSYAPGVKKAIDEFSNIEQYSTKILFERFVKIKKK